MIVYRLTRLPDLQTQTYTTRYGGDVRSRVFDRQTDFLTLIHELGMYSATESGNGSVVSLRFLYEPGQGGIPPQRIYLFFNNRTGMSDERLDATLRKSPLAEFYSDWEPVTDKVELSRVTGLDTYERCVELIKEEAAPDAMFKIRERDMLAQTESGVAGLSADQVEARFREFHRNAFYYVPLYVPHRFEPVADNDMLFLDRYFHAFDVPLMLEVSLRSTRPTHDEIRAVERMLNQLEPVKSFSLKDPDERNRFTLRDDQQDYTAEAIFDTYEAYHESLLHARQFEFAIKVWGNDPDLVQVLADQVAVSCNASGKYRKLELNRGDVDFERSLKASRTVEIDPEVRWNDYWDDSWERPFSTADHYSFNHAPLVGDATKRQRFSVLWDLGRFARLTELENIASFFRLPVPGPEPMLTLRKETEDLVTEGQGRTLLLGQDAFKPSLQHRLDLEQFKKHVFISGVPGSGKTTAAFNLLVQLHQQGIPFLVFEPAKTEYRLLKRLKTLAEHGPMDPQGRSLGDTLQVYTLGQEHGIPFRFNPFVFPEGITLDEHVSELEACFKGALPIATGPLPALINEAVDNLYARLGWTGSTVNRGDLAYPTLQGLYDEIQTVFESKGYSGDVRGDLQTAIEVRIGSLLRRGIGRIFSTDDSCLSIEALMSTPCVIELDALNEEQTNLIIMFLLSQIREYVRAHRRSGAELSHVIVLEEAHNIIGKAEPGGDEGGNPKAEATKYITRFLAEVRALGEGIIVADQLPSAVAPEVIKNTNVKLAHRMVAGDDREELGLTMLLDPNQYEDMARLPPGQAFLYREGMYKPVKIQGEYIGADSAYPVLRTAPPDLAELTQLSSGESWNQQARLGQLRALADNVALQIQRYHDNLTDTIAAMRLAMLEQEADLVLLNRSLRDLRKMPEILATFYEQEILRWQQLIRDLPIDDEIRGMFHKTEEGMQLLELAEAQDRLVTNIEAFEEELLAVIRHVISN